MNRYTKKLEYIDGYTIILDHQLNIERHLETVDLAIDALGRYEDMSTLKPVKDWHEDIEGVCLFWKFPIEELPKVTSPINSDWEEGYYTHFTIVSEPHN